MTAPKYRKKPVEVEAMHLSPETINEVARWVGDPYALDGGVYGDNCDFLGVEFDNGEEIQFQMDYWIVRGTDGELFQLSTDAFAVMYEPAEGEAR